MRMQLSVREAAGMLSVSEEKLYRWIKQGSIPAHWIQEEYRFNRAELLEWATARGMAISPVLFQNEDQDEELPSLSQALAAGGVFYGVEGRDPESVLRAVVDVLNLPEDVDRDFLFQVLLARETMGSTGIGGGIAIPHVRNPVVLPVPTPSVTLCFLKQPIDFKAADRQPVNTLFTLITPTVRTHLHLLSRLGFALQHPEFRQALQRQSAQGELGRALAAAEAVIPAGDSRQD